MDGRALLDVLQRSHAARLSADCLDDTTLAALADASLAPPEAVAAAAHLGRCMPCLGAYASVRRLLDQGEPQQPSRRRRLLAARVPLGWTVATAAAAAGLAWLVATTGIRGELSPGGSTVEMSGPRSTETISGTITAVERAGTAEAPAHVLEIAVESRGRYTVFVWGAPAVRVGQRASIEGHFHRDGGAHRGVAIRLTVGAR